MTEHTAVMTPWADTEYDQAEVEMMTAPAADSLPAPRNEAQAEDRRAASQAVESFDLTYWISRLHESERFLRDCRDAEFSAWQTYTEQKHLTAIVEDGLKLVALDTGEINGKNDWERKIKENGWIARHKDFQSQYGRFQLAEAEYQRCQMETQKATDAFNTARNVLRALSAELAALAA